MVRKNRNNVVQLRKPRANRLRPWPLRFLVRYRVMIVFVAMILGFALYNTSERDWTLAERMRHLSAAPNCAAARALGLAPARRGEPGYYERHDADGDGIACEPHVNRP